MRLGYQLPLALLALGSGCSKQERPPGIDQCTATAGTNTAIESRWSEYRTKYSVIYVALKEGEQFPEQLVCRYYGDNPIRNRAWKPMMPYRMEFEKNEEGVWTERLSGKVVEVKHDNTVTVKRKDGTYASIFYFPPTEKVAAGDDYDALCERAETTINHPTYGRLRRYNYLNPLSLEVFRFFWERGDFDDAKGE